MLFSRDPNFRSGVLLSELGGGIFFFTVRFAVFSPYARQAVFCVETKQKKTLSLPGGGVTIVTNSMKYVAETFLRLLAMRLVVIAKCRNEERRCVQVGLGGLGEFG